MAPRRDAPPSGDRVPPRPAVDGGLGRLRGRLRRRVRTRRLLAVAVASSAALAAQVHGGPGGGDDGRLVTVAVATRDLQPGDEIDDRAVRTVAVPAAVVPPAAAVDPIGQIVVAPVHVGEVVHRRRLSADRLGLRVGEVALALVRPPAPLPLVDGDVVQLVGVAVAGQGTVGVTPLGSARVLAADDAAVTVAVDRADALALVEHRARGAIEILLTPSGP